jgi:hypothetical protein
VAARHLDGEMRGLDVGAVQVPDGKRLRDARHGRNLPTITRPWRFGGDAS